MEPYEIEDRCPKCGCPLITNQKAVWCTFVGGRTEKACDFNLSLRRYNKPLKSENHKSPECSFCVKDYYYFSCPEQE